MAVACTILIVIRLGGRAVDDHVDDVDDVSGTGHLPSPTPRLSTTATYSLKYSVYTLDERPETNSRSARRNSCIYLDSRALYIDRQK